jgi:LPS-assembly lipoprotein
MHRRLFALSAPLLLAACGFQPLYMRTATDKPGPAQRELARIYVNLIPDRPGQELRQALQERFGDDSGTPAAYDLSVTFSISGEGIAITQQDIATRLRLTAIATYNLVTRGPHPTRVASGSARAIDGLNIFDSQYFAADLENEAKQQSLAQQCADQITNQLATYFRAQAAKQVAQR